ncbi:TetR/AcrR family transcriptional regulator [Dactylosporangium darangshiense]|uniref:TetR/AcrR family transcriptional regulator n=1 Tax=Dactylosporangium darangshiense TaxID=579108 RepID=UPI003631D0BC
MTTSAKTGGGSHLSARERLLDAASELFYREGVHTVGIDRVIAQAGVAKASLYNTFGSKDELIRAYLVEWHERWKRRIVQRIAKDDGNPREQLLGSSTPSTTLYGTRVPRLRVRQRLRRVRARSCRRGGRGRRPGLGEVDLHRACRSCRGFCP